MIMYSNSKQCHLLPWVGMLFLYPAAISAYGLLRRGSLTSESQMQTLCFDLSKLEHGQFGSRTMQASKANAPWLLDFDEVTEGPCKGIEEEELLTDQQMKEVTYCKHFGTSIDIVEYQLHAPRYFERFLYDIGAARGECMTADTELDSDDSMDSMVSLCFDLGGYGPQTVVVDKKASPWFLSNDIRVVKGECKRTGQKLDRREAALVTYCKHFGSPSDGYEYEIEAPEFLSDYLYTTKGVQRGECPSLEAGLVLCHVPEDLTIKEDVMSRRELRKKTRGSKKQDCNCSACEKKIQKQSGELLKEKKQEKKPSNNKDKPKIGKPKIGKNPNKNKPRPRPQPKPSQQGTNGGGQNNKKPTPKPNGQNNKKPTPKPNNMQPQIQQPQGQQPQGQQPQGQQPQWQQPQGQQPQWQQPQGEQPQWQQPQGQQPQNNWQQPTWQQPNTSWQQPNTSWQQRQSNGERSSCNDCICKNVQGFVHKPGTNCQQYVQCNDGCIVQNLSCGSSGLIFDSNLQVCQWVSAGAVCRPDPQGC